jgi:carbon storage regulator
VKVCSRAIGEGIVINDDITVTILEIRADEVVLAVDAPQWVEVCKREAREEVLTIPTRLR